MTRTPHCHNARRGLVMALCVAAGGVGSMPTAAAPQTHTVVIESMQFQPATLTVHRGDRVVWRNRDLVPHTATSAGRFDSHTIDSRAEWAYVADAAGTFPYVCAFHPTMKGALVVE